MNIKFYTNRLMATTLSFCMLGTCKIAMKSNVRNDADTTRNNGSYSKMIDLNTSVTELPIGFNLNSSMSSLGDKLSFVSDSDIEDTTSTTLENNTLNTTVTNKVNYLRQNAELLQSNNKTEVYLDTDGKVYVIYNGYIVNTFENRDYYEGSLKSDNEEVTTTTISMLQDIMQNSTIIDYSEKTIIYEDNRSGKVYVVYDGRIVNTFENKDCYEGSLKPNNEEVTTTTFSKLQGIIEHSKVYEEMGKTVVYEDTRDNRIYIVFNGNIVSEYIDKDAYNAASKTVDDEEFKTYIKVK